MNKIRKTPDISEGCEMKGRWFRISFLYYWSPIILEEFVAVHDDSNGENASRVLKSSEMRKIMKKGSDARRELKRPAVGVIVGRGQLRCHPRHLTMVQNDEVRHQKPSCS
ncbi:hypothetical protein TNCV_4199701 [Trichonephila clavipes]|uniref:Uncharacterized protein n=1 Tax=Trichonephila clavipes TaxID=2585209 RepID=A0A8X6WBB9_TRICX|nr:hypothetical protein TNCV_4199701 [Trichonephila clavipes]